MKLRLNVEQFTCAREPWCGGVAKKRMSGSRLYLPSLQTQANTQLHCGKGWRARKKGENSSVGSGVGTSALIRRVTFQMHIGLELQLSTTCFLYLLTAQLTYRQGWTNRAPLALKQRDLPLSFASHHRQPPQQSCISSAMVRVRNLVTTLMKKTARRNSP